MVTNNCEFDAIVAIADPAAVVDTADSAKHIAAGASDIVRRRIAELPAIEVLVMRDAPSSEIAVVDLEVSAMTEDPFPFVVEGEMCDIPDFYDWGDLIKPTAGGEDVV